MNNIYIYIYYLHVRNIYILKFDCPYMRARAHYQLFIFI